MSAAHGGDEISAIVLDVGADTTRIGYAGEDCPRSMQSSWMGFKELQNDVDNPNISPSIKTGKDGRFIGGLFDTVGFIPDVQAISPYREGAVTDWDALEALWEHCFQQVLRRPSCDQPVLLSESPWASNSDRERLAELAFEKFQLPALYFSNTAVLSAFAAGKTTGLVLDSGSSITSVVPVYEGYALKKGIRKQPLAGDFISECIIDGLERQYKYKVTPSYQIKAREIVEPKQLPQVQLQTPGTPSFHKAKLQMAVGEFKESTCQVFETQYNQVMVDSRPGKSYEFPDGFNAIFGSERYHYPEVLFQPNIFLKEQRKQSSAGSPSGSPPGFVGVHQLALDSVAACDVDLRPHLLSNIVVSGGTTLFPGFSDRLTAEISSQAFAQRVKLLTTPSTTERRYTSWLGGSILASLGTFHPLWFSKSEYQEGGATSLAKRFS